MQVKEQQRKKLMHLEELKRREEERVNRENNRRRTKPQLTGMMDIYCDDTTLGCSRRSAIILDLCIDLRMEFLRYTFLWRFR